LAGSAPQLYGRPGGPSWQARALNFVTRHAIKRRLARRGLSAGTVRSVVRLLEWMTFSVGGFATVHRKTIAGVPCDVVYPLNPLPVERVVLYLHGGGFFVHLPQSYQRFARLLADALGATVYLPAYRLAPEYPFPAATDDCLAVYTALLQDGCNPQRLCLMGDSAGGNLALVTLLRARDAGLALPACATVLSPGADLTFSGASFEGNAERDPMIPPGALRQVVRQYVSEDRTGHPYVSPMLGDFTGLPPLAILVGSTEVLLDSSVSTAQSSRHAGVQVQLQVWRDMPHVFPLLGCLPEARMALQHMAHFFNQHARAAATAVHGDPAP
jgi:acetyl esterase/lipase